MFDWLHNGEGLVVFNLQGLSDPYDKSFQARARRYAGDTFGERFQKATVIGPDLRARPHGGASSVRLRARRWQRVCMDVAHELDRSADAASRAGHLHRLR